MRGLCFRAPFILGLPLFSSKVFVFSLLHFSVASFFIRGLYFLAPCILGLPLFLLEVFIF
jgi:hypothetical protein